MRLAFTEAGGANNLELLLSSALENSPRQGKSKRLGHLRGKADERDVVPARDVDSVRQPGLQQEHGFLTSKWPRVTALDSCTAAAVGKRRSRCRSGLAVALAAGALAVLEGHLLTLSL